MRKTYALENIQLGIDKLKTQWKEEQSAGRLGPPESDSKSRDIGHVIEQVENYVRAKTHNNLHKKAQGSSIFTKILPPFLRARPPMLLPVLKRSDVEKILAKGKTVIQSTSDRIPFNGICTIVLQNRFPPPEEFQSKDGNRETESKIDIDPSIYEMGPLLCDVAKSLYETLESQIQIYGNQGGIYHSTLALARLLADIARNVALHPRECEHEDLLLSMLAAAGLCADLGKIWTSLSNAEKAEKLSNIDSYTKELQVAFDNIVTLQEQRRIAVPRDKGSSSNYHSSVVRDDIALGTNSAQFTPMVTSENPQPVLPHNLVSEFKDDIALIMRERKERTDIFEEFGIRKEDLNADTLIDILTTKLCLSFYPGPPKWESPVVFGERGGYGCVYPAKLGSNDKIAIKKFHMQGIHEHQVCLRILREARSWHVARSGDYINKRRILPLLGVMNNVSPTCKLPGLVSPWKAEGSIDRFILRNETRMSERLRLSIEVAEGLEYLHSRVPQIVHGDLKGSNILITLSRGRAGKDDIPHIQLCDFGLTKIHDNAFGLSTNFSTTMLFEAPELRETTTFTSASDMYAFGGVLLQILYSLSPFSTIDSYGIRGAYAHAKTPADFPKPDAVSPDHWDFMRKCWSRAPADRPGASDAIRQLEEFVPKSRSTAS